MSINPPYSQFLPLVFWLLDGHSGPLDGHFEPLDGLSGPLDGHFGHQDGNFGPLNGNLGNQHSCLCCLDGYFWPLE